MPDAKSNARCQVPGAKWLVALSLFFALSPIVASSQKLLIQMDLTQANHLKAYGIAFMALTKEIPVDWLLNYRGGSFVMDAVPEMVTECRVRGVSFDVNDG